MTGPVGRLFLHVGVLVLLFVVSWSSGIFPRPSGPPSRVGPVGGDRGHLALTVNQGVAVQHKRLPVLAVTEKDPNIYVLFLMS